MKQAKTIKTLCILGLILFTLVLAADLAVFFLVPSSETMEFSRTAPPEGMELPGDGGFQMPGNGEMPEGGFQMPGNGEMPEGGFQMPENGEMPGGGDFPMPGGGERPEGGFPGGMAQGGGFLQTVRNVWWLIAIGCLLGDGLCIFGLIRLRKKALPEEPAGDEEPAHKRRSKGSWLVILVLVMVLAMLLGSIPTGTPASGPRVNAQVLSGVGQEARMDTVLSGAGTLEAGSLTTVAIAQIVTVEAYHVRNGETVAQGDPLVSVDRTSASSAMMELQAVLQELDKDLETARKESPASYITAAASGRVKEIYVEPGDRVETVMYGTGALMLLSLDGKMAVSFACDQALVVGEAVEVTLSDGTVEAGRVESLRQGVATVTIPDETAPNGDPVVVTREDSVLGQGTLEVHSPLKVQGSYGKVKSISVKQNGWITRGGTLLTLEDTGHTQDYALLLLRRAELEAQMAQLSQLAATGMVCADRDGIVTGVPENAEIELLSSQGRGYTLMLLSSPGEPGQEPGEPAGPPEQPEEPDEAPEALNGTYAASLVNLGGDTIYLWLCPMPVTAEGDLTALQGQMTQFGAYPHSLTGQVTLWQGKESEVVALSELREGDLLLAEFSQDTVTAIHKAQRPEGQQGSPLPDMGGGVPGGGMPSGAVGGSGMTQTPAYTRWSTAEQELLQLSGQEEVSVTIQVDELDILQLREGLQAQVTLDAMKGRSFSGIITALGTAGQNDGGNTKFTVTVTFPREEGMVGGMNASVKIITASCQAELTVPAEALVEQEGRTWLYTGYDRETDTLTDLVEVETGACDGLRVEILSGLTPEDTFWYRYADTVEYEFVNS